MLLQISSNLYVWYNPNKNVFYYKINKGFYQSYKVGSKNSYGHECVLIVPVTFKIKRDKFKIRLIKKLISLLEKLE